MKNLSAKSLITTTPCKQLHCTDMQFKRWLTTDETGRSRFSLYNSPHPHSFVRRSESKFLPVYFNAPFIDYIS